MNQRWAQENADDLKDKLEHELKSITVNIQAGCGQRGWAVDYVRDDGNIVLVHDCFDEHHYDYHDKYAHMLDLDTLEKATP